MSFSSVELSDHDGRPIELFWFMRGSDSWAFNSSAEEIEYDNQIFKPLAGLTRSSMRAGQERNRNQLTVEMPRDTNVALEFRGIPHLTPMWLYIYGVHDGDGDVALMWQGRVRGVEFPGEKAVITLDNIMASTKKQSLRHYFQGQCNHFTFDLNCGLLEDDFATNDVPVASVDGSTITLDDAEAAGYYKAGQVVRGNGDRRMIVNDEKLGSTHTFTLLTAFENLTAGESVRIVGGACRHTFDTCPIKANYGGYPKVPRKNPFKSIY